MTNNTLSNSKSQNKNIDLELVNDFKEGLEELKKNKVIRC